MTTPSSLEELREKTNLILDSVYSEGFNQPELVKRLTDLFHSHMEAVIDNIVKGPRDSWIQYDKKNDNFAHGFAIAQKMIEDRAKSYLEGEK